MLFCLVNLCDTIINTSAYACTIRQDEYYIHMIPHTTYSLHSTCRVKMWQWWSALQHCPIYNSEVEHTINEKAQQLQGTHEHEYIDKQHCLFLKYVWMHWILCWVFLNAIHSIIYITMWIGYKIWHESIVGLISLFVAKNARALRFRISS